MDQAYGGFHDQDENERGGDGEWKGMGRRVVPLRSALARAFRLEQEKYLIPLTHQNRPITRIRREREEKNPLRASERDEGVWCGASRMDWGGVLARRPREELARVGRLRRACRLQKKVKKKGEGCESWKETGGEGKG